VPEAPSLSRNPMPPRTTRKSYRPRVSDRTMVGSAQPFCLSRQKPNGSRCNITMNLGKSEITAPHNNTGLDDQISSGRAGTVFLDIPFYRTGFSESGQCLRFDARGKTIIRLAPVFGPAVAPGIPGTRELRWSPANCSGIPRMRNPPDSRKPEMGRPERSASGGERGAQFALRTPLRRISLATLISFTRAVK